jgi:hypothetical protein
MIQSGAGKMGRPKSIIVPSCHNNREYYAKNLCIACYKQQYKKAHRRFPPKWRVNPINSYIVYMYFTRDGIPIYVGRGTIDRALSHKYSYKNSSWWNKDLILLTMTCKDEWEAMEYEGKWGGLHHPIGNRDGNRRFKRRDERRSEE